MNDAILELADVSIAFDNRVILAGLTFDVKRGEALCITGPSGSGKTVLLKLCAGLLAPTAGRIRHAPLKESSIPGAGFVFEYGGLLSNLTVFNNVALPLRYHTDMSQDEIAAEVYAIFAKLRMMVFADEFPARLSLGTRKLASLARAIAMRPQIIYYDEPTLGLDRASARAVQTVMEETCREAGVTSVAVTHDTDFACRFAHRVVILGDGGIRGIGSPADMAASQDPRIRGFFAKE